MFTEHQIQFFLTLYYKIRTIDMHLAKQRAITVLIKKCKFTLDCQKLLKYFRLHFM